MNGLSYFFGQSTDGKIEFKYFSFAHFIPLVIMAAAIYFLFRYREKLRNFKYEDNLRYGLAISMLISEMSYFWRMLNSSLTPNSYDHLPITICGWACVLGSFMLFTKKKFFFDVCYFWVMALSFNALITPAVLTSAGPTRFRYYQFWYQHIAIYIAVLYMIFVHGYRPFWRSMINSAAALAVLSSIAISVNTAMGTDPNDPTRTANYLFIAATEDGFSIANILPGNAFVKYTLIILLVGLLFFLAYLPWFIMDYKKKNQKAIAS